MSVEKIKEKRKAVVPIFNDKCDVCARLYRPGRFIRQEGTRYLQEGGWVRGD